MVAVIIIKRTVVDSGREEILRHHLILSSVEKSCKKSTKNFCVHFTQIHQQLTFCRICLSCTISELDADSLPPVFYGGVS